ncbi:hypothetical protein HBB16_20645, partial [Pseudonocardia sp. MCCB 268]|nr:hypothetical protein [Pseudonocardia cytotoxica]
MGKVKKYCRSKPKRCARCPVVAMRLRKTGADRCCRFRLSSRLFNLSST